MSKYRDYFIWSEENVATFDPIIKTESDFLTIWSNFNGTQWVIQIHYNSWFTDDYKAVDEELLQFEQFMRDKGGNDDLVEYSARLRTEFSRRNLANSTELNERLFAGYLEYKSQDLNIDAPVSSGYTIPSTIQALEDQMSTQTATEWVYSLHQAFWSLDHQAISQEVAEFEKSLEVDIN